MSKVAGITTSPVNGDPSMLPTLVPSAGAPNVLAVGCLIAVFGSAFCALFRGALWDASVMMGILGLGLGISFAAIPGLIVTGTVKQ